MTNSQNLLEKFFGYDNFRPGQEEIINNILNQNDCLGIMPTGAGKSICYQIPAMLLPGVTIVISPLISLMKDQVDNLNQIGIPATFINSSLSHSEYSQTINNIMHNVYKIIYVAPERLTSEAFLNLLNNLQISMFTIDEAHCVSQWGHDFRPSYREIANVIVNLKTRPVVSAFTATATNIVKEDIINLLHLQNPFTLTTGFDRANLKFSVQIPENKNKYILNFLQNQNDIPGIIYCATRKLVDNLFEKLTECGYKVSKYHGGMNESARAKSQDDFVFDRTNIMIATNAFGMGIDKPDVRYVIHYNMPMDLESYYQEAGRAGRDGEPAQCILLYSGRDVRTNEFLLKRSRETMDVEDEETRQFLLNQGMERLKQMTFYATSTSCLRHRMLRYFGDHAPESCGNCSCCLTNYREEDATMAAKKISSCVYRAQKGGYQLSRTMTADVLIGSKKESLLRMRLDRLSTYGIIEKLTQKEVVGLIDELLQQENLALRPFQEYQELALTAGSVEIIRDQKKVMRRVPIVREKLAAPVGTKDPTLSAADNELFQKLRQVRSAQAKHEGIPPYFIFSDATLRDMCRKKPRSMGDMRQVSGVGVIKAQKYGKMFLEEIQSFQPEVSV